jgi:hypothetical protein
MELLRLDLLFGGLLMLLLILRLLLLRLAVRMWSRMRDLMDSSRVWKEVDLLV